MRGNLLYLLSRERYNEYMNTINHDSFYGLGIAPGIMDLLKSFSFTTPTPIQRKAIPIAIEGKDVIGIAQTGTGKTIAFGIPLIQRLAQQKGRGLILVPTRELAIQVNDALKKLARVFSLETTVLIGGESMMLQLLSLRKNPRIIVVELRAGFGPYRPGAPQA